MNVFLQFKKKSHSVAYDHDLELQVAKRLWMILVMVIMNVGTLFVNWAALGVGLSKMAPYDIARTVALVVLLGCLFILKCTFHRATNYLGKINFFLDICLIYCAFVPFPYLGKEGLIPLTKFGVWVIVWSFSLMAFSSTFAIANWWLRATGPIFQVIFFLVPMTQEEMFWRAIIIVVFECLILYACFTYIGEKFQRKDFLEKRKVYENYEAIKRIFDDIIQGIMIVDPNYNLIYSNRTIDVMFGRSHDNRSLDVLFSQIQVKSINPQLETLATERIQTTHDESEPQNTLKEYMELISKVLFVPNAPENSVTAEVLWWNRENSSPYRKNFSIKFTTSLFMNKNVIVINVTDTTDRDSLIAAQASSEYKSRLLSSVSHELRTPLNGSINFIEESLIDSAIPSVTKEKCLIPALRSNRLLLSLVNDILDFSQMHAGKLRLVFESRSIVETAKDCMELLEIQASKKSLKLTLQNNLPPDQEVIVTDHNRVRQVILNLLSNAVKFTFHGGILLILDPTSAELPCQNHQRGDTYTLRGVRVTCRDTGIGISPEDQKKLFKAFEKIDLGARAFINSTGAGLGLLISNGLVQKLSPEELPTKDSNIIRFESKPDEGASFSFEIYNHNKINGNVKHIDLEKSSSAVDSIFSEHGLGMRNIEEMVRPITFSTINRFSFQGIVLRELRSQSYINSADNIGTLMSIPSQIQISCKCPKVLIVDDDPFNLTALDQILSRLKVPCHWAFNGKEAIEKIEARQHNRCGSSCQQYKIVFLDCNMPILDGYETARRLRAMEKRGEVDRIRIIACTAFVQQSDENNAKEAGMDDFSTKPIKFSVIKEKLKANGFFEK